MSENILMCKIAHFLSVLCAILNNTVRNFYVLTRYTIIDAKIAHSLSKVCMIVHRTALSLSLNKSIVN